MKCKSPALNRSSSKNQCFTLKKIHVLTLSAVFALVLAGVPFCAPHAAGTPPETITDNNAGDYETDGNASFTQVNLSGQDYASSITAVGSISGSGLTGQRLINLNQANLTVSSSGGTLLTSSGFQNQAAIYVKNASLDVTSELDNEMDLGNGNLFVYEGNVSIDSEQGSNIFKLYGIGMNSDRSTVPSLKITAEQDNEFTTADPVNDYSIWIRRGDFQISAGGSNIFNGANLHFVGARGDSSIIKAGSDNIFKGTNLATFSGNLLLKAGGSNILNVELYCGLSYRDDYTGSLTLEAGDSNFVDSIVLDRWTDSADTMGTISLRAGNLNDIGGGEDPAIDLPGMVGATFDIKAPTNRLHGSDFAVLGAVNGTVMKLSAEKSNEITGGKAGILFLAPSDAVWDPDPDSAEVLGLLYSEFGIYNYVYMADDNTVSLTAGKSNVISANGADNSVGIGIAANASVVMSADEENRIYGSGSGAYIRSVASWEYLLYSPHTDSSSLTMSTPSGVNSVEGTQNGIALTAQRQIVFTDITSDGSYVVDQMESDGEVLGNTHSALATAELTTESGLNSIVSEGNALSVLTEKKAYAGEQTLSEEELSETNIVYRDASGVYSSVSFSKLGDASAAAVISAQSGTNEIVGGVTAISAEGYGTGDESAASVTVSTVSGRNVISGGEAALSAGTNGRILVEGPSTVTGAVEAEGEAASIELDYGADSAVTGNLSSASGASIVFTPQDGGTVVLTGTAQTDTESTLALNLSADSVWYMTGLSSVSSLTGTGSVIYKNGGDALEIGTLTGSHTFALDLSMTGSESDMLYIVNGSAETQTLSIKNGSELGGTMAIGDAVRFATIKNAGGGFGEGTELTYADGPVNYTFTIDYRDAESDPLNTEAYNDAYNGDGTRKPTTEEVEATYDGEGSSNVYAVKTAQYENAGGRTASAAGKLVWRYTTDMDTYTRRTAQSTEFMPGSENGAWLRAAYHRLEADGSGKLHGPFWELGFSGDVRSSPERTHRIGFSAGYTVQSGSWAHDDGSVRVKDATAAFYYTMLGARDDTGASVSYWDNVLRYHHLRTHTGTYDDPSGATFDGNRTQEAVSLSSEYGRRIPLTETVTLTPQAQFQLTYVGGFDSVDSEGMRTEGDHDWSAVARIGADLSRRWGEGGKSSAYLKASLLHEFSDGQEIRVSGHSAASRFEHPGSARGSWAGSVWVSTRDSATRPTCTSTAKPRSARAAGTATCSRAASSTRSETAVP